MEKYTLTQNQKAELQKTGYVNITRNGKQVRVTTSMVKETLARPSVSLFKMDHLANPDEKDLKIATDRIKAYNKRRGPRVGDFIIMPDGSYQRFSYKWPEGLQTSNGGSYFLGSSGYASMSGSLNRTVPNKQIKPTPERKEGPFWFFHHDMATAHNAVGVRALCRVYRHTG